MKYIKTFESYRSNGNDKNDTINEEFLGALGKMIGNMFTKAKQRINKTKGGKEIETIYQKYINMIDKELVRTAKIELKLGDASDENEKNDTPAPNKKSETDSKNAIAQLKAKKNMLDQIVNKLKTMALKEMDSVLNKYGGSDTNPQLDIIINTKKDQFELDYMNAKINYLEFLGDKKEIIILAKQRDQIAKKIESEFKNFDTLKSFSYKEGDEVIYLLKGKTKDQYNSNRKPQDQSNIVGIHKIHKIEGDKFTLLDKNDKPTIIKKESDIIGKTKFETINKNEAQYKVGDKVKYKMNDGNEAETTITKINGDKWFFQGADKELSKDLKDIISKIK